MPWCCYLCTKASPGMARSSTSLPQDIPGAYSWWILSPVTEHSSIIHTSWSYIFQSHILQSYTFQSSQSHISIIHISIITWNISWSYISQSYISSLDLDLDLPRLTRPHLQMLCTCITRHILQSHNGLEHIFVLCWRDGNWGFHCLKTLKFQNFSGRCPEPRWGAHSAPHTPSWFCLVPPGHLNPGSATGVCTLAQSSPGACITGVVGANIRVRGVQEATIKITSRRRRSLSFSSSCTHFTAASAFPIGGSTVCLIILVQTVG